MEKTNNVTLEAVKLACEMIFEKEFNMKLEIPVLLSGRLKRSLGRFYYSSAFHKPTKLVFNKSFFTNPAYDLATLESVLLHECVHAELCIKGIPFDDRDPEFIKECKRVGATLTREIELIKVVKYVAQCEKCGAELEVEKTVFNHINMYRTKCCKADLVNKRIIHLDVKEDKNKSIVNCHTNYLETAIQILNNKRNDIKQIKSCADESKKDEKICEGVLVFEGKSRKINQTCLWRSLKYHYENRDIVKIRIIRDAYPEIYPNAFRCLTKTIQNYITNNI